LRRLRAAKTLNYATHGVIVLRAETPGEKTVVRLDLTGNCAADLQRKVVRFWPEESAPSDAVFSRDRYAGFQDRQIGPTGTMTAQGWVRTMPCSGEEFTRRAELGEPQPTEWKRRLYLEWYGQNGRVVIEMAGAIVEECTRDPEDVDDEGDWALVPNLAQPPGTSGSGPGRGLEIESVRLDKGDVRIEHLSSPPGPAGCADEPYESVPDALQQEFDDEAVAMDRAIGAGSGNEDGNVTAELELMDYCIEHGEGQPVAFLLGDIGGLPRPETLNDEDVESRLKVLLAQMARVGVALDVCEHFTPRDCYRLLLDKLLPPANVYEKLMGTSWVQRMTTYDYCPDCEAEIAETMLGMEDE